MSDPTSEILVKEYFAFLNNKNFPCVAARAAISRKQIKCFVADNMACPKDDKIILQFLYNFVNAYRTSKSFFHSAVILFKGPKPAGEEMFETLMWQRLQAISNLDAENFHYDKRVNANPSSANFSFSIMEEAFFIIGMHPDNCRPARRFNFPVLVFNPHAQFENLKMSGSYINLKSIVRKRDLLYSGSVNPMLQDFGEQPETLQYSGREYEKNWQCPLKINHG